MTLIELYHYFDTEVADPRTNDWFFVRTPVPMHLITLAYLYFVLKWGPRYMKNRPPYKLKGFIKCYNIFQIVTNMWIVYAILEVGWYRDYFISCVHEEKYPKTPQGYKIANLSWYIASTKIVDYIETGLFVLRKKENQISFLHLYHHVSTVTISWVSLKYFISGMAMTIPVVNSSVHVIMYTYYLLSSFGPSMQKRIKPVKSLITIVQMGQFWFLMIYSLQAFTANCPGHKIDASMIIVDLIINFILFYNFYKKTYVKKEKQK